MIQQLYRIALPIRIQGAIDRLPDKSWRLWLHTPDFIHGTFLLMHTNGCVERVTVREDEGDEIVTIKDQDNKDIEVANCACGGPCQRCLRKCKCTTCCHNKGAR